MNIAELNISFTRPGFELNLNARLSEGITGIYGPSGAGKTTLLHLIAGLEVPQQGQIVINDHAIFHDEKKINLPIHARKMGYVFQDGRLFPHLSIEKNLRFAYPSKRNYQQVKLDDVVNILGLRDFLASKPNQLSGGQAQRVAIGRALLAQPEMLLLDEPFSNLDKKIRNQIIAYLLQINQLYNIPMLVVSHELPDILKLTRELLLIGKGRMMGMGNYYALIADQRLAPYLETTEMLNVMELHVSGVDKNKRTVSLTHGDLKSAIITTESEALLNLRPDEHRVVVGIGADDIALALHRVQDISMQNQIPGTVEHLISMDDAVYCIVNCGFYLLVEITHAALSELNIKQGDTIYCLFKSKALRIIYRGK